VLVSTSQFIRGVVQSHLFKAEVKRGHTSPIGQVAVSRV
jgi:hypothetical protein